MVEVECVYKPEHGVMTEEVFGKLAGKVCKDKTSYHEAQILGNLFRRDPDHGY